MAINYCINFIESVVKISKNIFFQAVREEIENLNRPDVVQQTDSKPERNYRWYERIIEPEPDTQLSKQIIVPLESAGEIVYTTGNNFVNLIMKFFYSLKYSFVEAVFFCSNYVLK